MNTIIHTWLMCVVLLTAMVPLTQVTSAAPPQGESSPAANQNNSNQSSESLARLKQEFFDNPTRLETATAGEFQQALFAASDAGMDDESQFQALLNWLSSTQKLSEASAGQLAYLMQMLRAASGEAQFQQQAQEQQLRITRLALRRLSSQTRDAGPAAKLESGVLLSMVFDQRGEAARHQIKQSLQEIASDPAATAQLFDGPGGRLVQSRIFALNDSDLSQNMLTAYLTGSKQWQNMTGSQLAVLYQQLTPPINSQADVARNKVAKAAGGEAEQMCDFMLAILEQKPDRTTGKNLWTDFEQHLLPAMESEQTLPIQLLTKLASVIVQRPDQKTAPRLLLQAMRIPLDRGGEVVGELGAFHSEFAVFAQIIQPYHLDNELRQLAVKPEGSVRVGVSQILAEMYNDEEQMHDWRRYLEEAAQQPELDGDERARWLLARAYAALVPPPEYSNVIGAAWLDQALREAQSEQLRYRIIEQMVRLRWNTHDYLGAYALLASVENQFEDKSILAQITHDKEQLNSIMRFDHENQKRIAYEANIRSSTSLIEIMNERLSEARREGRSAEDIASLEETIASLEMELKETRMTRPW